MNSRMDKYKDEAEQVGSRTLKNQNIYNKIDDEDFEKINLSNNVSVLEANPNNLDINQLKELLDQKYQSKRDDSSAALEVHSEPDPIDLETTKEYDLKKVLETAHKNKDTDYDHERFKKLRETQFDILNSLNIHKDETPEPVETLTTEEANLMNLIKTVDFNAAKNKAMKSESDELSGGLFDDLKAESNTQALDPISFDETIIPDKKSSLAEELEKTKKLSRHEISEELEKIQNSSNELEKTLEDDPLSKTQQLQNTFYTGKYPINEDDLEDFADLEKEMKGGSIVIKILIIILVLIVLAVGVFLLNKYLNLGLF